MKEMTVQELTDLLNKVEDKTKPVRMSIREYDWDGFPNKIVEHNEEKDGESVVYIKEV